MIIHFCNKKLYRNFTISIVFYCFRHYGSDFLHTALFYDDTTSHYNNFIFLVLVEHIQKIGVAQSAHPMYGVAQNRPCKVGLTVNDSCLF